MLPERRARRRRPTQDRSKLTVDAILEATRRLIADSNVGALRMRDVARVAGVSTGTLYQYFETVESLLAAWEEAELSRRGAEFGVQLSAMLAAAPPWEEAIYQMARLGMRLMREHMQGYRREDVRDFLSRMQERTPIMETIISLIASTMTTATERERLRFEDPEVSARLAVKSVMLLGYDIAVTELTPAKREVLEDAAARMLVHGLIIGKTAG